MLSAQIVGYLVGRTFWMLFDHSIPYILSGYAEIEVREFGQAFQVIVCHQNTIKKMHQIPRKGNEYKRNGTKTNGDY